MQKGQIDDGGQLLMLMPSCRVILLLCVAVYRNWEKNIWINSNTYREEAFGILKDVDATVAEVWLLRTPDWAANHTVLTELSLTVTAATPRIPLLLEIPVKMLQLFIFLYIINIPPNPHWAPKIHIDSGLG